jgi:hypothetical protein
MEAVFKQQREQQQLWHQLQLGLNKEKACSCLC